MKNILKTKYISFLLALVMVVGIFLPCGGALAKENGKKDDKSSTKYSINIDITINNKKELKEKLEKGQSIEASHREVKVYKLKVDKEMTDEDRLKLAKDFDGLTIAEAEKKLKDEKKLDKEIPSEKSKYFYGDKAYDKIDPKAIKDFKLDNLDLDNEKIEIKDLDAGYYLIKETDESKKIPNKKLVTQVVKIPGEGMTGNSLTVVAKEEQKVKVKPKDIKLIKVDANNKDVKLDKAEFELYKKGDTNPVHVDGSRGNYIYNEKGKTTVLETWNGGEIIVQNLPEGTYYFKETKPAPGYPEKGNKGTLSKNLKLGESDTVENKSIPILKKVVEGDENKTLDGVEFEVYKQDGTKLSFKKTNSGYEVDPKSNDKLVTKDGGFINITNLENGKYYFKEKETLKGYILSDKKYDFEIKSFNPINEKGEIKINTVTNKPEKPTPKTPTGGFNFVKIDSTKDENRLGGAKFILMKKVGSNFEKYLVNGKEVKLTSKDNGEFAIDGLPYGEYALKEVEAPKNHTIINDLTPFTVDAASSSLPAKKIVNEPYTPKTIVSKTNTITTKYTPNEITRIVKTPLVKTGDIRIVVMAIVGLILLMMGIKLVNSTERMQRI